MHTALVWFGAVGRGERVELTAVGDAVNTTARLASMAKAGEILVTTDAATAAGLDPGLQRRQLELKGKQIPTEVVSLARGRPRASQPSMTRTSLSTADSAPHSSPGRPRSWRTEASGLGSSMASNASVAGSNLTIAFPPKSVSQTMSRSST